MDRCDVAERGSDMGVRQAFIQVLAHHLCTVATWEVISLLWTSVSSSAKWHLQHLLHRDTKRFLLTIHPCSWHCAWHSIALSEEQN